MNVAFYAPMKPPNSVVASGDRSMARGLLAALDAVGHRVELAARLVSREPTGDGARQARLRDVGAAFAARLVRRYRARTADERPQVWFTYHLYYKAPDWIGPLVADALSIPYVVAEASFAPKRAEGPWRLAHAAVRDAIRRADLVFGINSANDACVRPLLRCTDRLVPLKPFAVPPLPRAKPGGGSKRLLTVAMMRAGAKFDSYRILAAALRRLPGTEWSLTVVGDGPKRAEVETMFAGLPVTFVGAQAPDSVAGFYANADLFVWPAIDESFGMAIVEAQAAGLPVAVGDCGGVADTVECGVTGVVTPVGDSAAFADAVARLLADPAKRAAMGAAAAASAEAQGFSAAARLIDTRLRALVA